MAILSRATRLFFQPLNSQSGRNVFLSTLLLVGILFCAITLSSTEIHSSQEVLSHTCITYDTDGCTNIAEHLAHWQAMSTVIFTTASPLAILFLLAGTLIFFVHKHFLAFVFQKSAYSIQIPRFQEVPPTLLQELFSQGLLNSKAY